MTIELSALQQQRRDTAANWTGQNPTLLNGEIGYETDTGKFKIGDGSTAWTSLNYLPIPDSNGLIPIDQLLLPAGTAAAPSLTFTGDVNTGIYSLGADQFGISTGGTAALTIDSSQRVGIGTASPDHGKLTLFDSASAPFNALVIQQGNTGSTASDGLHIGIDSAVDAYITHKENRALSFGTANTERMRIDSSGNVGIGTTSPLRLLDINNSTHATLGLTSGDSGQSSIFFADTDTNIGQISYTHSDNALYFRVNDAERMRIDASGNVGMGTSSPSHELHVAGAGTVAYFEGSGGSGFIGIEDTDDNTSAFIGVDGGSLKFQTSGNSYSDKLVIDSSGRLLVGTTTPGATAGEQLTIAGSANAGMTIRSSASSAGSILFEDTASDRGEIQYSHNGDYMRFKTAGSEAMRIDSSGNVGIGTTSASGKVHIQVDDSGNSPNLLYLENLGQANGTGSAIFFRNRTGTAFTDCSIQGLGTGTNQSALLFSTETGGGAQERMRIDSSGRLLVGTSSSRGNYRLQVEGSAASTTDAGELWIGRALVNGSIGASTFLGKVNFGGQSGGVGAVITAMGDGGWGTDDYPGRLVFSTTADGASSPTERVRINQAGDVYLQFQGGSTSRVYMSGSAGAASIGTSSFLSSSTTLYIGNAAIQVSSDARLKEDIEDTKLDALNAISQVKVRDFTWNDPSDTSHNNRNARGKWTGLIAQELVDVLPFVVNAPRKEEDGSIDYDSEARWTLDQSQLCPVLIKAVQQQQDIIAGLEARLSALENA